MYYKIQHGADFKTKTEKIYSLIDVEEVLKELIGVGITEVKVYRYERQPNGGFMGLVQNYLTLDENDKWSVKYKN